MTKEREDAIKEVMAAMESMEKEIRELPEGSYVVMWSGMPARIGEGKVRMFGGPIFHTSLSHAERIAAALKAQVNSDDVIVAMSAPDALIEVVAMNKRLSEGYHKD